DHFRLGALTLYFGLEATTHAAIRAGGLHGTLGLTQSDDGLLRQCGGRTRLDAGTARDTLGIEERLVLTRGDFRVESAALDRQGKRALHLIASPYAARAHD